MSDQLKRSLIRFARVFVFAGLASVVPMLSPEASFSFRALSIAFVAGGIAAIEKYARWKEDLPL